MWRVVSFGCRLTDTGRKVDALAMVVPDTWVYRAADRLIRQYEADALAEVNRLICDALDHREPDHACSCRSDLPQIRRLKIPQV